MNVGAFSQIAPSGVGRNKNRMNVALRAVTHKTDGRLLANIRLSVNVCWPSFRGVTYIVDISRTLFSAACLIFHW